MLLEKGQKLLGFGDGLYPVLLQFRLCALQQQFAELQARCNYESQISNQSISFPTNVANNNVLITSNGGDCSLSCRVHLF